MKEKKSRSSNIELLRIVGMFMIIILHIVWHCVIVQLTDGDSISRLENGVFNHPAFYKKLMILYSANTFGGIGNALFMLISGYFLLQKDKKIDLIKISKKLVFQLLFATVILTVASLGCFFVRGEKYISLIPISRFNSGSWFVGYYFLVILFGALFLNDYIARASREKYTIFLIVLFTFIQLGWSSKIAEGLMPESRTLGTGIFLYSLGGYIRKYEPFKRIRTCAFFLMIIVCYFFVNLSAYNTTLDKIEKYVRAGSKGDFIQSVPGYGNYSLLIWLIAVSLFEIFRRIDFKPNKFINFLGESTFMVYLLHDNDFVRSLWLTQDWITLLSKSPALFSAKMMMWGAAVFLCGVIGYLCYLLTTKLLCKYKYVFLKGD